MCRIIVIDDDKQLRNMLKITLTRAGYDVAVCCNGIEGLKLQKSQPANLVITDILMPEKEGLETIIQLKKESPQTRIIAISGGGKFGPKGYLFMADRLGADLSFTKPVDQSRLLASVKKLCAKPISTSIKM